MPDAKRLGTIKKWSVAIMLSLIIAIFLYMLCLCFPQPFFAHHVAYENLRLYSDRPVPAQAMPILGEVQRRLRRSPIYDPGVTYRVFVCNDPARFAFFANFKHRVGGISYELFRHNSFLRGADIAHDRLIAPSGRAVPGDRTLTYFITHEIVHGVTEARTGLFRYFRLAEWVKDGYADYVAVDRFDFKGNLEKFKRGSPEMDPAGSGLYLKYHLFVAYLLDVRKIGTDDLLKGGFAAERIAAELRRL
jgi:hypothetical protein